MGPLFLRLRYGQGCRPAVEAEPALPVVDPLPLMPELDPELPLEAKLLPDEPELPLMPELEPDEPEPEAAVFSFGCPVALSRQWVAGDTEADPALEPDEPGELGDCATAASTVPPRKADASNAVLIFIERSYAMLEFPD